jgi:hypothetical protein
VEAMTSAGMKFLACSSFEYVGWEVSFTTLASYRIWKYQSYFEPIKIDVRQLMRESTYTWMGAGQTQFKRHQRWLGHISIVPADFEGIPVGVPNDVDSYLTMEYGDYYEVLQNFKWDTSQRNLVSGIPRWHTNLSVNFRPCTLNNRGSYHLPLPS